MKRKSRSFFNMQFITASISTMLVLLLLGLVVFFVLTANNLSVYVRENIAVSVQLSDDMPERDILQYQKRLNEAPYVKETTYISKVQALREQTEAMGTDPAEFIGHNPFNASIEIKLNSAYANSDSIQWIQDELLSNKNILEVNYPQELMDSVNRNLRKISLVLKRFLIHTMKLVGASWSFIRRPFLWQNIWIGIFAAILADALLTGMSYFLIRYEPDLLTVITPTVVLIMDGAVFIFGVIITTLCAWISINKFLRMKAGELYYM